MHTHTHHTHTKDTETKNPNIHMYTNIETKSLHTHTRTHTHTHTHTEVYTSSGVWSLCEWNHGLTNTILSNLLPLPVVPLGLLKQLHLLPCGLGSLTLASSCLSTSSFAFLPSVVLCLDCLFALFKLLANSPAFFHNPLRPVPIPEVWMWSPTFTMEKQSYK